MRPHEVVLFPSPKGVGVLEAFHNFHEVETGKSPIRDDFILFQAHLLTPFIRRRHLFLGSFGNLPVLHLDCIISHIFFPPSQLIVSVG
jgi:hypothetical protein